MYSRLAFATAIQVDPDILIVDEVLSVGDVAFQKKSLESFDEIKKSATSGTSVSATYKVFKGDFDQSQTFTDFKVRQTRTLMQHSFNLDERQSRDSLRQFLEPIQIEKWLDPRKSCAACMIPMPISTATRRAAWNIARCFPPAPG